MEILRFDSDESKTPRRKKSSRGLLMVGLVATLFGISSAFASSTITINTDNKVNLGQGVVKVSGCDTSINVVPTTVMAINDAGTPTFYLDKVALSNIDTQTTNSEGYGCAEKTFDIQIFHEDTDHVTKPYLCDALQPNTAFTVGYDTVPETVISSKSCSVDKISFTMPSQATFASHPNPIFTLHFDHAPSDINYITIVSRS
jgi:hypothetical protein